MNLDPTTIIQYAAAIATGVGIWYKDVIAKRIGLKKAKSESEAVALANVQRNLDIYQEMIDDIDSRYKSKLKDMEEAFVDTIDRLKVEIQELKEMNQELSGFLKEQKEIIGKQSRRIDYFKKKYNEID